MIVQNVVGGVEIEVRAEVAESGACAGGVGERVVDWEVLGTEVVDEAAFQLWREETGREGESLRDILADVEDDVRDEVVRRVS